MPSFTFIASVAHKTFSLELDSLATQQMDNTKIVLFAINARWQNKSSLRKELLCWLFKYVCALPPLQFAVFAQQFDQRH